MKSYEYRKKEFIKQKLQEKIPQKKALQQQLLDLKLLKKVTKIDSILDVIKIELTTTGFQIKKIKQELGLLEKALNNLKDTDYKKKNFEYKVYNYEFFIDLKGVCFIFNNNERLVTVTHESDNHFLDKNGKHLMKKDFKNTKVYSIDEIEDIEKLKDYDAEENSIISIVKELRKLEKLCINHTKKYYNPTISKLSKILPYYRDIQC